MPQSLDTLRVGHFYKLINYGEETVFELTGINNKGEYLIKDLNSLEIYTLRKLIEYGQGKDYDLYELAVK